MITCAVAWWLFYYAIIYPSIVHFSNKQAYKHGSPVKRDFEAINNKLDKIMEKI